MTLISAVVCGGAAAASLPEQNLPAGVTLRGELKQGHAIELDLAGPSGSETAATFRDNRFVVTFSKSGQPTLVIPGFFAADGDAANTGATTGGVWRCLFRPPTTGRWAFTIAFHTGANIAASAPGVGGTPTADDGKSGWFTVAASDKVGLDMRAPNRGRLVGVGVDHILHFAGDPDHHEIWAGAGSPENFLACSDIDGTRGYHTDTARDPHPWTAHAGDWRTGDPVWQAKDSYGTAHLSSTGGQQVSDAGKGIIGALNYLAEQGTNTLYMVVYTIDGGDSRAVYPWVPSSTEANNPHDVYDCSKLDQWRIVLEHANRVGITPLFFFHEVENYGDLDGGDAATALGVISKVFAREMVARFGHLNSIVWVIAEEMANQGGVNETPTDDNRTYMRAWAQSLHDLTVDGYRMPITCHNNATKETATFQHILGFATFDGIAQQVHDTVDANATAISWRSQSQSAGRPWIILNAEQRAPESLATDAADPTHDDFRIQGLWANLIGGGVGISGIFEGEDVTSRDLTTRANAWAQCRIARQQVKDHLPNLAAGVPDNVKVGGVAGSLCFRRTGNWYAVYVPPGAGTVTLDLTGETGTWEVRWVDTTDYIALTGGGSPPTVAGGSNVNLPARPNTTDDWLGLVIKQSATPTVRAIAMRTPAVPYADLGYMYDGMVIDLADTRWQQEIWFFALCDPGFVSSVTFSGVVSGSDGIPPYAIAPGWTPVVGSHSITATPAGGTGLTINFSVINNGPGEELTLDDGTSLTLDDGTPMTQD